MTKKPVSQAKRRLNIKKFINNWDKFDSIFGFIAGAIAMAFVGLIMNQPLSKTLMDIKPFAVPLIVSIVFFYCLTKAMICEANREFPAVPKGMWHFLHLHFVSGAWVLGGLLFATSVSPEVLEIIINYFK